MTPWRKLYLYRSQNVQRVYMLMYIRFSIFYINFRFLWWNIFEILLRRVLLFFNSALGFTRMTFTESWQCESNLHSHIFRWTWRWDQMLRWTSISHHRMFVSRKLIICKSILYCRTWCQWEFEFFSVISLAFEAVAIFLLKLLDNYGLWNLFSGYWRYEFLLALVILHKIKAYLQSKNLKKNSFSQLPH